MGYGDTIVFVCRQGVLFDQSRLSCLHARIGTQRLPLNGDLDV
jgi:hypothetical protein